MAEDREFARIQLVKNHAATTVALANAEIELYRARNDARPVSPILVNKPAIGVSQPAQAAVSALMESRQIPNELLPMV